jgi:hypothetical protein
MSAYLDMHADLSSPIQSIDVYMLDAMPLEGVDYQPR